jgi:hypothetical protein
MDSDRGEFYLNLQAGIALFYDTCKSLTSLCSIDRKIASKYIVISLIQINVNNSLFFVSAAICFFAKVCRIFSD